MDRTWGPAFEGPVKEEVVLSKIDSAVGHEIPVKLLTYQDGSMDLFRPQGNQFREHLVEAKALLRKRGLRAGAVELMVPTGGYLPVWEKRAASAAAAEVAAHDHRVLTLAPFEGYAALLALEEAPVRVRRANF